MSDKYVKSQGFCLDSVFFVCVTDFLKKSYKGYFSRPHQRVNHQGATKDILWFTCSFAFLNKVNHLGIFNLFKKKKLLRVSAYYQWPVCNIRHCILVAVKCSGDFDKTVISAFPDIRWYHPAFSLKWFIIRKIGVNIEEKSQLIHVYFFSRIYIFTVYSLLTSPSIFETKKATIGNTRESKVPKCRLEKMFIIDLFDTVDI